MGWLVWRFQVYLRKWRHRPFDTLSNRFMPAGDRDLNTLFTNCYTNFPINMQITRINYQIYPLWPNMQIFVIGLINIVFNLSQTAWRLCKLVLSRQSGASHHFECYYFLNGIKLMRHFTTWPISVIFKFKKILNCVLI